MDILNVYKHGNPEGAVYIGRKGKFGNSPLGNLMVIGKDGTRLEVIAWYREWLKGKIINRDPEVILALRELRDDSKLLCFCVPQPCHGEVIREFWEELNSYESFDIGLSHFIDKYSSEPIFNPKNDGIDHINIYSKGTTLLGRLLSNFAHTPFTHPDYGHFNCIEGFWYWLGTGQVCSELKVLVGFDAKKEGRKYPKVEVENFQEKIKEAIRLKIEQNPSIEAMLKESVLPFTHYYYYGKAEDAKVITRDQDKWLVQFIEILRAELKTKQMRVIIAGSRDITDINIVRDAYKASGVQATEIVSGECRGVDRLGEQLAAELHVPVKPFPADWDEQKRAAGHIRNAEMARYADYLICIHRNTPGSLNMIENMKKLGKPGFARKV